MDNWEEYRDIFAPFEKLIEVEICGRVYSVPENNELLRCFQFLNLDNSNGDFCWNGTCANCQVWIEDGQGVKPILSCRTFITEKMRITKVAPEILLDNK